MTTETQTTKVDVVIAGAGFAGLACATALARRGLSVVVLERKKSAGSGIRTTGLLVKEAALLLRPPENLVRRITDVCLYAPSLKSIRLRSPDYFFLSTDTAALMEHFGAQAVAAGAVLRFDAPFAGARRRGEGFVLPGQGLACRFLIGADGARSAVAAEFGLGRNRHFLVGAEAELEGTPEDADAFHCFLGRKHAPGYLGWAVPGVGVTQAGLAVSGPHRPALAPFLRHIGAAAAAGGLPLEGRLLGHRGGLIPAGGLVRPFSKGNVILLGDAAGLVSPLTGGSIHTALHYGFLLGERIAAHLLEGAPHPQGYLAQVYPRFRLKRLLRRLYEHTGADWILDAALGNPAFRLLAQAIFFRTNRLQGRALHENCTIKPAKLPISGVTPAHLPGRIEITRQQNATKEFQS